MDSESTNCAAEAIRQRGLRAVSQLDADFRLEVLHNHVDHKGPIQLHIVQALVLEVGPKGLAGLLCVLQDLLLSVLATTECPRISNTRQEKRDSYRARTETRNKIFLSSKTPGDTFIAQW